MKLVSIIVPVFNVEEFVGICLNSIVKQTYKTIEIIIINDGSTDNSREICEEFVLKDNRITLINQENQGLSSARNVGLKVMKGEYVCFVDSDDWIETNFIEYLVDKMEIGYDIVCCGCNEIYADHIKKICAKKSMEFSNVEAVKEITGKAQVLFEQVQQKIYRSYLFVDLHFEVGKIHEDTFITLNLFGKSKKIGYFNIALYNYRIRNGSITNNGYSIREFDRIEAYLYNLNYIDNNFPDFQINIRERIIGAAIYNYINVVKNENIDLKYKEKCENIFMKYKKYCFKFKFSITLFLLSYYYFKPILLFFIKLLVRT
ncbi:MAG: glycosyltransferase [Bacilli bacterium]